MKGQNVTWVDDMPATVMQLFRPWVTTLRALEMDACELTQRTLADAMLRLVFSERPLDEKSHTVLCVPYIYFQARF